MNNQCECGSDYFEIPDDCGDTWCAECGAPASTNSDQLDQLDPEDPEPADTEDVPVRRGSGPLEIAHLRGAFALTLADDKSGW